jgi:hypothetical protein
MTDEPALSPLEPVAEAPPKRVAVAAYDVYLREWVTWVVVGGTGFLGAYFFWFLIYRTFWGEPDPGNWLTKLTNTHYAALVGTPMSAVTAFCIVSLLKVTNGPIEFEALGFGFRGASGPIILWVLCFLSVVVAFHLLWWDIR